MLLTRWLFSSAIVKYSPLKGIILNSGSTLSSCAILSEYSPAQLIKNSDWKMELLLSRIFKSLLVLIDLIFWKYSIVPPRDWNFEANFFVTTP